MAKAKKRGSSRVTSPSPERQARGQRASGANTGPASKRVKTAPPEDPPASSSPIVSSDDEQEHVMDTAPSGSPPSSPVHNDTTLSPPLTPIPDDNAHTEFEPVAVAAQASPVVPQAVNVPSASDPTPVDAEHVQVPAAVHADNNDFDTVNAPAPVNDPAIDPGVVQADAPILAVVEVPLVTAQAPVNAHTPAGTLQAADVNANTAHPELAQEAVVQPNVAPLEPANGAEAQGAQPVAQANGAPPMLALLPGAQILGPDNGENNLVSTVTRPYFQQPLITRVNRLLRHGNVTHHVYGPRSLPNGGYNWQSEYTSPQLRNDYLRIGSSPITLWIVGEVRFWKYQEYVDHASLPVARPCMGIAPIIESDLGPVRALLHVNSRPIRLPLQEQNEVLWLQRWMGKWNTPVSDLKIFDNCYDGTTRWQGPENTELIPASSIKTSDLVLVEAVVTRWSPKVQDASAPKKYDRRKWIADLQLEKVVLLASVPEVEDEAVTRDIGPVDF